MKVCKKIVEHRTRILLYSVKDVEPDWKKHLQ